MNITPIKTYGATQNFTAKKTQKKGKTYSSQGSDYIYPVTDADIKDIKGPKHKKTPAPKITKTIVHWMNYGGINPVPILVEVAAD